MGMPSSAVACSVAVCATDMEGCYLGFIQPPKMMIFLLTKNALKAPSRHKPGMLWHCCKAGMGRCRRSKGCSCTWEWPRLRACTRGQPPCAWEVKGGKVLQARLHQSTRQHVHVGGMKKASPRPSCFRLRPSCPAIFCPAWATLVLLPE